MNPRREGLDRLVKAIGNAHPVDGLTHAFYRYPARFSPIFARAVLETFTKPGDVVLDPFMGGGTTLVEARALGRIAMGLDINSLAVFVTRAKTTLLNDADVDSLREWGRLVTEALNLRNPVEYANRWIAAGYHTNMGGRTIWPVRKTIALALDSLQCLQNGRQKRIARIVVLKTGQWALDCRSDLPTAKDFRQQLALDLDEVLAGTLQFRAAVRTVARQPKRTRLPPTLCLNRSAEGLEQNSLIRQYPPPMLILTSPPYPGVHVLYHRWQIHGRRETSAPFWIANSLDGNGASFYTFGDRQEPGLMSYFRHVAATFSSLAKVASPRTVLVQMVAFTDRAWQLRKYLAVLRDSGWSEVRFRNVSNSEDGRMWREIPNRKWYAHARGDTPASREVVLFHRLR